MKKEKRKVLGRRFLLRSSFRTKCYRKLKSKNREITMNKGKMSYLRSKSFNKRSRRKNKTKSIRRREKGSKLGESLEKMRLKRRKGSENSLQRKRGPIN